MAIAKTAVSVLSGATTTQTSLDIAIDDCYVAELAVKIDQVGTATAAATFQVQTSPDGSTWYNGPVYSAGLAAGSYPWPVIAVSPGSRKVRVAFTAQSGGTSSTINVQLAKITSL